MSDPQTDDAAILPPLEPGAPGEGARTGPPLSAVMAVRMDVRVVLGTVRMPLADVLRLSEDSVVTLDRRIGDPVDVVVGDRLVARGDLVRTEGGGVGVQLTTMLVDPTSALG